MLDKIYMERKKKGENNRKYIYQIEKRNEMEGELKVLRVM